MEKSDRDMLIRVDERVRHIHEALPKLTKKVDKHDKIIFALVIIVGAIMAKFKGGWELVKDFFV